MVASVFLFSIQNAIGKWLAQTYPIPMLVFFRSAVALLPSFLLVLRAGGVSVLRTNRLGAQFGRAGADRMSPRSLPTICCHWPTPCRSPSPRRCS
jgi:hypothetical protein